MSRALSDNLQIGFADLPARNRLFTEVVLIKAINAFASAKCQSQSRISGRNYRPPYSVTCSYHLVTSLEVSTTG